MQCLRFRSVTSMATLALLLSACGGGGSGGTTPTPAPTVTLTASPSSITGSGTSTLTWSSTNATSCTASGGWTGSQATSGTAATATLSTSTTFTLACTGAGGTNSANTTVTVTPVSNVTVSGIITFDKVPFSTTAAGGLDFTRITQAPARGVTVEAINSGTGATITSATTDASGQYSVSVPANTNVFIRAKAQMVRTGSPSWNFSVRDNTASDALYTLDGSAFNSGAANSTRNLNAPSGWNGTSYATTRAAAPFSILDVAYQAYSLVLTANASAVFPTLQLMWSTRNVPTGGTTAAELALGQIGTTFFASASGATPARIYVLGAADNDTDEFDQAVLAHEWGHYYQNVFSRDDSLGGSHSVSDKLDLRVAFSEGWGNAFSGMVRGDPVYRDSFNTSQRQDFSINVETPGSNPHGWFSEESVQSILWDVFDSASDAGDSVSLGFAPVHASMIGSVRTSAAFTTIYPLLNSLRTANASQAAGISTLAVNQLIGGTADDFGAGETNNAGDARNLPIYQPIASGGTLSVCSTTASGGGTFNHVGNRKFLRFDVTGSTARTATIAATAGPTGSDPDLVLYSAGVERGRAETNASGAETLAVGALGAGTYVLEVYEYSNVSGGTARGDTCFNVQLTLN